MNGGLMPLWITKGVSFMDDFIKHHGVKGMRWGVRKDRYGQPTRRREVTIRPQPIMVKQKTFSILQVALPEKVEKQSTQLTE